MAKSEDLRMAVKHYLGSGDTLAETGKIFGVSAIYKGTFSFKKLPLLKQDKETYEGDCLTDFETPVRCGRGEVSFGGGDKYVGEFANNNKNGLGIYYYNDPKEPELFGKFEDRLYYESDKLWSSQS